MIRKLSLAALPLALAAAPAWATLPNGAPAPDFATEAALGGRTFHFQLAEALRKGPVVLYFFPKAFTKGCTLEAHAFAAAMGDFHKAGATVLGLSADDLATLQNFSGKECSSAFPVAPASAAIIKAYDTPLRLLGIGTGYTARTTYVIAPGGKVVMSYSAMDWQQHVPRALAAVRGIKGRG